MRVRELRSNGELTRLMAPPRDEAGWCRCRRFACSADKTIAAALIACYSGWLSFAIWTLILLAQNPAERVFLAASSRIAGVLCFAAVPLSIADICQHFFHYSSRTQRLYIRILLLPPIYTIESYVALAQPDSHFILETLRETYECIALLAVYDLARETLGSDADIVRILQEGPSNYADRMRALSDVKGGGDGEAGGREPVSRFERLIFSCVDGSFFSCSRGGHHASNDFCDEKGQRRVRLIFPFCSFEAWPADDTFLRRCSWGVAQYVVVRISTSIITLILENLSMYGDGAWDVKNASLWLTIVINCSQLWALWCLIFFAATLWPALEPLKPLNKFLCVKIVVFVFWWQSICLSSMASFGWFDALETGAITSQNDFAVSVILQDVLITGEIVIITILHHYNFGLSDFTRPELASALLWNQRRRQSSGAKPLSKSPSSAKMADRDSSHTGGLAAPPRNSSSTFSDAVSETAPPLTTSSLLLPNAAVAVTVSPALEGAEGPNPGVFADLLMLDVIEESFGVVKSASSAATGVMTSAGGAAANAASAAAGSIRVGVRNITDKMSSPTKSESLLFPRN